VLIQSSLPTAMLSESAAIPAVLHGALSISPDCGGFETTKFGSKAHSAQFAARLKLREVNRCPVLNKKPYVWRTWYRHGRSSRKSSSTACNVVPK
jgi:hypothetical protein